jgi:GTP-binding protein
MIDLVHITVISGHGGSGAVSFRREKYVPRGGPDGGDGGNGGDIFIRGARRHDTLMHIRNEAVFQAEVGGDGGARKRTGKTAKPTIIEVPIGTRIWIQGNTETLLGDVMHDGEEICIAKGGAGGLGNSQFATSTQQVPLIAEAGGLEDNIYLRLELKLLADVAFIGKPSCGKSTLISQLSGARPKIAEYPFTTLEPVLGVVSTGSGRFVAVEIPGLIEGAHRGAGLGQEFLRHASRCGVLIHLIDGADRDVFHDFEMVRQEVVEFGQGLEEKPWVIAVNKIDIEEAKEMAQLLRDDLEGLGPEVHLISGLTGEGLEGLVERVGEIIEELKRAPDLSVQPLLQMETADDGGIVSVTKDDEENVFEVVSYQADRLVRGSQLGSWAGQLQLWAAFRELGVVAALAQAGAGRGDTVRIGNAEFEWV